MACHHGKLGNKKGFFVGCLGKIHRRRFPSERATAKDTAVIDCIRLSVPEDAAQVVAINNATWPGYPTTVAEMRAADHYHDPHSRSGRWVAEKSGRIVAVAQHDQIDPRGQPGTYWIEINVHPDHQRQGIGGALYLRLMEELKAFDPVVIRAVIREEQRGALHFFQARGFEELWRVGQTRLDLTGTAFRFAAPNFHSGFSLVRLAQLTGDPRRDQKLYDLHWQTWNDALLPGYPGSISREQYISTVLHGAGIDRDGFFVAVAPNGDYAGLSILDASDQDHVMALGWLGVRREARGQGLGMALLSRAASRARARGARTFVANLNSLNEPLSRLCDRVGFARQPALVHLVNVVK